MKLTRRIINSIFPTSQLRNSVTVRYAFSFLFLFAAIVGMAAVASKDSSYIRIASSAAAVDQGDQFSVDVFVYANTPVNAVDISIAFPPSQVEVLGIDKGQSVITLWTEEPHIEGDLVVMRGGTYKKGFVGEHKIATINVKAKSAGKAEFLTSAVKLLAGDGKGSDVKADVSRGTVLTSITPAGTGAANELKASVSAIFVTDIDGDGAVSIRDISSFMASWANKDTQYDFNNDGAMTFKDFSIILAAFIKS